MTGHEKVAELVSWETVNGFSTVELVKEFYNCERANVLTDGSICIEGPQTAQWLSDENLARFADWVDLKEA